MSRNLVDGYQEAREQLLADEDALHVAVVYGSGVLLGTGTVGAAAAVDILLQRAFPGRPLPRLAQALIDDAGGAQ